MGRGMGVPLHLCPAEKRLADLVPTPSDTHLV